MESFDLPRLLFLVVLGAALIGWFLAENRQSLGGTMRQALAWVLIFVAMIAGYGLWQDVRQEVLPRQAVIGEGERIEVPQDRSGHYHLTADVNGTPIRFLIDTGATDMVLSLADAERAGLSVDDLAFIGTARTANGEVRTAFATLDEIAIGPLSFDRVRVSVNAGEMEDSLMGMSFLRRFGRIEITDGALVLEP